MLEAFLFVALLVIPLVVLQQQGQPPPPARDRPDLARNLAQVLAHYEAAPEPATPYASLLERMVAEALQGNTSSWDNRLPRALPPLAEFNAFLDNGQGLHRLRWDGSPPGEAVSAPRLWSPSWGVVLAAPQVRLLDAERSALRLEMVPLRGATGALTQPGMEATVTLTLPDGSARDLAAFAPLRNATAEVPGVGVALLDASANLVYAVQPAEANATLVVGVKETQGRAVPAGTTLEVRLPPGFRDVTLPAANNTAWTDRTTTGSATEGWTLRAKLAAPLASAQQQLHVNATRPAWGHFHLVEARLDGGRLGSLQGLFVDGGNSTRSAALPPGRGPFLSVPGHAPWSAEAPMGVVVANPDSIARTLTITKLTVQGQGGAVLTGATGSASPGGGGAWSFTGGVLQWEGSHALARDEAGEFRFTVKAHAPVDQDSVGHHGITVDLGDHEAEARAQRSPGLFAARFAPANASAEGFPTAAGVHDAVLNATHKGKALQGKAPYEVSTIAAVQASASDLARGLDESWLRVDTPRVAAGAPAQVAWDLTRLRTEVVGAAGDAFKCYKAADGTWGWEDDLADCLASGGLGWQFVDEAPAVSVRFHHPGPAAAGTIGPEAKVRSGLGVTGSTTWDVPHTALYGLHVVELRADFRLDGPGTEEATQTVRLLAVLEVTRDGGPAVDRPLYDVVLQAWLPDWV
jgi:hypothetical protein